MRVIDGDTFQLNSGEIVRLLCIDAPELNAKGGEDAKEFLEILVLGKEVGLEKGFSSPDKDAYGRLLRYVYADSDYSADEVFVNREMVYEEFAVVFDYGSGEDCGSVQ